MSSTRTKRSLASGSDDTPVPKRAATSTPATTMHNNGSRGRVVLDVGGTAFVSSRSTLEAHSTYFRSLLMRWNEDASATDPIFVDADPDAFACCLSYMRSNTVVLPAHDLGLCSRVLVLAEFLGLEDLLEEVKAKAMAHMCPDGEVTDTATAAAAFDETVGTLQQAISTDVLPARFFTPEPVAPPEPPERTIKALYPVAGYRAFFQDHPFDGSGGVGYDQVPVVALAIVMLRSGREVLDALIQLDQGNADQAPRDTSMRDEDTRSNFTFASDFAKAYAWEHWELQTPAGTSQKLLPIPPGSVRGKWMKPAITMSDVHKPIIIVNGAIIVDGEPRNVSWGDAEVPVNMNGHITSVDSDVVGAFVYARMQGSSRRFENPALVGHGSNAIELALPFASIGNVIDANTGELSTTFYVPKRYQDGYTLHPAEEVKFDGKTFAGFSSDLRHR